MNTQQEMPPGTQDPEVQPASVAARSQALELDPRERRGAGGRSRRWRRLFWVLGLVLLAAVGLHFYRNAREAPEVEAFTFTGKPSRDVLLDLSGFIVPKARINVSPEVAGPIAKVHFEEGALVKEGQLLIEIEDIRYRTDYEQAKSAYETAKAQAMELHNGSRPEEKEQAAALVDQANSQVELSKLEWDRARRMFPGGAIGASEYDKAKKTLQEAEEMLRAQKASKKLVDIGPRPERIAAADAEERRTKALMDRAEYFCKKTRIYSPANATVLEKKVAEGEHLQADLVFTTLCVLADLSKMEAEVDVQERDLHLLQIGNPCEVVADAYPDHPYRGKVNRRQPLVSRQRGVVQVKITILNPDELLLPDMNCRVLLLKETPGAAPLPTSPLIPRQALVTGSEKPGVYVFDGQVARLRSIEVGPAVGDAVPVLGGLQAGDVVLVPGSGSLNEGRPVRPRLAKGDDSRGRKDH